MNEIIDQPHYEGYAKEITRDFFKNVYGYMFLALGISGIVAVWAGTPEFFIKYFISESGGTSSLFYIVSFAPIGLGLLLQMAYKRLSFGVLITGFIAYSVLMGLSLSTIFLAFTAQSIAINFFISAGAFAGMAILGYTTKTDLTKMGSLLYMAFIGIFIASIVNVFIGFEWLNLLISVIGVFVFTGLTAYYMQQLKRISQDPELTGMDRSKLSLIGGLQLYILFINLFISLLNIMGRD